MEAAVDGTMGLIAVVSVSSCTKNTIGAIPSMSSAMGPRRGKVPNRVLTPPRGTRCMAARTDPPRTRAPRNTSEGILREHGIEPAPERGKRTPWNTFLQAHRGAIAAADFFTVEVLTPHGVFRDHVLPVIELWSRRVEIARI